MDNIPANARTLEEALQLSEEILTSIDLETTSLSSCMLKASRLARLLNDFEYQQIFRYESSGYPNAPNGVTKNIWQMCVIAGRIYTMEVQEKEKTLKKDRLTYHLF